MGRWVGMSYDGAVITGWGRHGAHRGWRSPNRSGP